jgi:hypothetical protein
MRAVAGLSGSPALAMAFSNAPARLADYEAEVKLNRGYYPWPPILLLIGFGYLVVRQKAECSLVEPRGRLAADFRSSAIASSTKRECDEGRG